MAHAVNLPTLAQRYLLAIAALTNSALYRCALTDAKVRSLRRSRDRQFRRRLVRNLRPTRTNMYAALAYRW